MLNWDSRLNSSTLLHQCNSTAIVHQIREQLHVHTKSLMIVEYPITVPEAPPRFIEDDDLASAVLPVVIQCYRADVKDKSVYGPQLVQLTEEEVEKLEKDRDRDTR